MSRERFLSLSTEDQIFAGSVGASFGLIGAVVENVIVERRLCKTQQIESVPPTDKTYDCPPHIKAGELAAGSGIIIVAIFAAAAITGAIKRSSRKKSQT
ncbi:hypothetical protein HYW35_02620 [Candidatus Saccharibacteria bacterium]|nr:hypothetical protein [Candidatus Saccharibacteria bacterium]